MCVSWATNPLFSSNRFFWYSNHLILVKKNMLLSYLYIWFIFIFQTTIWFIKLQIQESWNLHFTIFQTDNHRSTLKDLCTASESHNFSVPSSLMSTHHILKTTPLSFLSCGNVLSRGIFRWFRKTEADLKLGGSLCLMLDKVHQT